MSGLEHRTDGTGQSIYVHRKKDCSGQCAFHNPTDHNMRKFPTHLRESSLVERICPHGVGHPDPDSLFYFDSIGKDFSVHGCCHKGCCGGSYVKKLDDGFGNVVVLTHGKDCDMQVVRPGKFRCSCDK